LSSPSFSRSIISQTLRGRGAFSPELDSVVVGGVAEASTAILSRDGLSGRRRFLVPVWLPGGLKVFRSLSTNALVVEIAAAADTLLIGRASVSLARLGRLAWYFVVPVDIVRRQGADEVRHFRFSDGRHSGVDGSQSGELLDSAFHSCDLCSSN
jgi:hypothetical protein